MRGKVDFSPAFLRLAGGDMVRAIIKSLSAEYYPKRIAIANENDYH
jgi:hypothetical protein